MRGGGTGDWGPKYEAIGETSSCQKQKEMQRKNLEFPIQSELFGGCKIVLVSTPRKQLRFEQKILQKNLFC